MSAASFRQQIGALTVHAVHLPGHPIAAGALVAELGLSRVSEAQADRLAAAITGRLGLGIAGAAPHCLNTTPGQLVKMDWDSCRLHWKSTPTALAGGLRSLALALNHVADHDHPDNAPGERPDCASTGADQLIVRLRQRLYPHLARPDTGPDLSARQLAALTRRSIRHLVIAADLRRVDLPAIAELAAALDADTTPPATPDRSELPRTAQLIWTRTPRESKMRLIAAAGLPGLRRQPPGIPTGRVLVATLAAGADGLLNRSLRDRHGLTYAVTGRTHYFSSHGLLTISALLDTDRLEQARGIIIDTISQLATDPRLVELTADTLAYLDAQAGSTAQSVSLLCDRISRDAARAELNPAGGDSPRHARGYERELRHQCRALVGTA